jgi:hypothetical protein
MTNRFLKLIELGAKGKNYNPLILEEFQWENEWVDEHCVQHQDQTTNAHVQDQTTNALDMASILVDQDIALTQNPRGRRVASVAARAISLSLSQTNAKKRKRPRKTRAIEDIVEDIAGDGSEQDDANETQAEELQDDESDAEMDVEDSGEGGPSGAASGDEEGFALDETLLA